MKERMACVCTGLLLSAAGMGWAVEITVDPNVKHQVIGGWEATAWIAEPHDPALPHYRDALYRMLVEDVGINRLRLEIRSGVEHTLDNWGLYQTGEIPYETWRARRYATVNDDADPAHINWDGFHFTEMDWTIEQVVNPLRQRLAASGETLYVNVNYVAFTSQIRDGSYLHDDPEEYAEFVAAACLHIRDKYGWTPDAWEILLEPDNVSQWSGQVLGQAIVAVGDRLAAEGMHLDIIAPSTTNMGNAVTYFDGMLNTPRMLDYLTEYSYHRYGGVSQANLAAIVSRARQHGLNTSMLEWWTDGNTYHTLHEDLKVGMNSAWQQAAVRGYFDIDDSTPTQPKVTISRKTQFFRQYYRYVRTGAQRIGAGTSSGSFDPLAFINEDGRMTVVVKAGGAGNLSVAGLRPGVYGVRYTTSGQYDAALPDQDIDPGEVLQAGIPAPGVMVIHQKTRPSDFDRDGTVGLADFRAFAAHWLGSDALFELTADLRTDLADFAWLAGDWESDTTP